MKGAILAGGPGVALKPISDKISKPMIRILNKPLIQYSIERLASNGIKEIIIVRDKDDDSIPNYFGNGEGVGVSIEYISHDGSGIDSAVMSLFDVLKNEDQFVVTHCDIIAAPGLLTRTLNAAENLGTEVAVAVALEKEIQDFGLVSLNSEGYVEQVFPDDQTSKGNYVVAGTFVLNQQIFGYLKDGIPFNQCFNAYIKDGGLIAAGIWNDKWIDVGQPWDILRANYLLLEQLTTTRISKDVTIEHNVEIKGPVIIEENVTILNGAIIKGPVFIGSNAFIGNNTLIRDRTIIEEGVKIGMGVEVRSSVIMKNASVARLSYIGASVVGPMSTVHSGAITINSRKPYKPIRTVINGKEVETPLQKYGAVIGPESHIGEHSSLEPGTVINTKVIIPPNTNIGGYVAEMGNE